VEGAEEGGGAARIEPPAMGLREAKMATDPGKVLEERTFLRTLLQAFIVAVIGILLLYFSNQPPISAHPSLEGLLRDLGDLLVASVTLYLLWELHGKRAFMEEVEARLNLASKAKISMVTDHFYTEIPWREFFANVKNLDIFVVYASTWRKQLQGEFEALARTRGARIRIILPDPEDPATVQALCHRLGYEEAYMRECILEAYADFTRLQQLEGQQPKAKIEIFFLSRPPLYSYYRFDDKALLSLFSHKGSKQVVPAIVCERGGTIYSFLQGEFDSITKSQAVRKA
jgi:hypothetical protein